MKNNGVTIHIVLYQPQQQQQPHQELQQQPQLEDHIIQSIIILRKKPQNDQNTLNIHITSPTIQNTIHIIHVYLPKDPTTIILESQTIQNSTIKIIHVFIQKNQDIPPNDQRNIIKRKSRTHAIQTMIRLQ